jgi:hypothetical protein
LIQQTTNNPSLSSQSQNSLGINPLSNTANVTQQNSLDPWLALYAAALNPQSAAPQQSQQDTNSLTQQWAQWLKTAQMVNKKIYFQSFLNQFIFYLGSNSTTISTSINNATS